MNYILAFILTSLAGLSTMLGCIFIFLKMEKISSYLIYFLTLAGATMIFISIIDLIPTSYDYFINNTNIIIASLIAIIFIILGIITSHLIDKKVVIKNNHYYKLGIVSLCAMLIHNIPEGIITFISSSYDLSIGIPLVIAIALHNIPEGITISLPIYYSTKKRSKAVFFTLIASLAEPVAALITFLFLKNFINIDILNLLFLFIAGLMIKIGFNLLKEIKKINIKHFIVIFISFLIVILSTILN